MAQTPRRAAIVGAGPAGLTAAHELLSRTDVRPIVFESLTTVGGISRTTLYKGNRIDIGGHRFFSKSQRVMAWWLEVLPLQEAPAWDDRLLGRNPPLSPERTGADPERTDRVMLVRERLSRIFFRRALFDYPIRLDASTIRNLGPRRIARIGLTYLRARLAPIRPERSLEDFLINRFGRELYATFFGDYTAKVWGAPCRDIPADWGAQRIKGLSVGTSLRHALRKMLRTDRSIHQRGTETSLIERFLYPKLGPGQLWETVADRVSASGGEIRLGWQAVGIDLAAGRVRSLTVRETRTGREETVPLDYLISTMPVRDLIAAMPAAAVPGEVQAVARGLRYRDFITVGLLVRKLLIRNGTSRRTVGDIVPDNWIYIQERDVRLGRLQIFNNWSPYLVRDRRTVWLGLEYFCDEGDDLWRKADPDLIRFAAGELESIGILRSCDVLDATVLRVPKTYPAYFGSYERFHVIRRFTDAIPNLFLVGRNGMHRYNNADHSMLTAMLAVENIAGGITAKENLWAVNTEADYHEER
jgi:protoporphyrinogen oxidase